MDKSRNTALDILRIIAAFSVVMLHVSSRYIMASAVDSSTFRAANFYDSVSRYGVPIFVMISGAIFLNPDKEIHSKRLWIHNILRLVIVYIIWGYAYYIYHSVYEWKFDFWHQGLTRTVTGIAYATDHLWFLGMLCGLYAITPILRSWLSKAFKQNIEYFLLLFFVFEIVLTSGTILLDSSLLNHMSSMFGIAYVSGYIGYYVLGYYLIEYEVSARVRYLVYASIPVDIILNYLVSWRMSKDTGTYNPGIYDSFGLFTFLESVALFLLVTYLCKGKTIKPFPQKILKLAAMDTFGIYLVHIMIIDFMYSKGVFSVALPSLLWEIPVALGVFVIGMIISALLRRIPYIGRYLA